MPTEKKFSKEEIDFHEKNHRFSPSKSFDYDQISDQIFLGTNMCCQVGFSRELLNKGITGDISVEKERIDNPKGADYFLWLPVEDHQAPTRKQMDLGVQTIDFFVKNNIKFYCHCKYGHGRAPTLIAAYLISRGMSVAQALDFIKKKRPSIHLQKVQIQALEKFKR